MGFTESVRTVLTERYADFQGRSARPEYWWFVLFNFLVNIVIAIIAGIIGETVGSILSLLVMLALIIPGIAVTVRRLHDTDRSGWWILIALIPIVGTIVLLVFMLLPGTPGENRFGPDTSGNVAERFA